MDKNVDLKDVLHVLRKDPYVTALQKLRRMGVLQKHSIQSELGEWVAQKIFGGTRMGSTHPTYDLVGTDKKTYQIKTHNRLETHLNRCSSVGHKHADIYVIFLLREDLSLDKALGGTLKELQESNALRLDKHGQKLHWGMMPELTPEKARELGALDIEPLKVWKNSVSKKSPSDSI
ncbi:MAG TPA: hypothetical protein PK876_00130 [Elusimicrobiota bacterium]|nr:hypothetical protein [Elusimicrobiota bacterium]